MKIICIARNYIDHISELSNKKPKELLFFLKPDTSLLLNNKPFFFPTFSKKIDHEVEILVKINKVGKKISREFANKYYKEISLGIDFTARDIQEKCKRKGLPWEKSKGFDGSAQISNFFIDKSELKMNDINFRLERNGIIVQNGNSRDMIFNFNNIISHISKFYTLKIGDLIYTGTPRGVGKVKAGDVLIGYLNDKEMLKVSIK